jgi:hypothetical protein
VALDIILTGVVCVQGPSGTHFILFCRVRPNDVGLRTLADTRPTVEDGATFWTKVICVNVLHASDSSVGVGQDGHWVSRMRIG